jgi:hypothetical protein
LAPPCLLIHPCLTISTCAWLKFGIKLRGANGGRGRKNQAHTETSNGPIESASRAMTLIRHRTRDIALDTSVQACCVCVVGSGPGCSRPVLRQACPRGQRSCRMHATDLRACVAASARICTASASASAFASAGFRHLHWQRGQQQWPTGTGTENCQGTGESY